jgi:hypothetical protein
MPMFFGFKSHSAGRYYHFSLRTKGFLHRFESEKGRLEWLGEVHDPTHPRFVVKSTDLVRMNTGVSGTEVKMIHQVANL